MEAPVMDYQGGGSRRLGDLDLGNQPPKRLSEQEQEELIRELTGEGEVEFHEADSPFETENENDDELLREIEEDSPDKSEIEEIKLSDS